MKIAPALALYLVNRAFIRRSDWILGGPSLEGGIYRERTYRCGFSLTIVIAKCFPFSTKN
jgi:hypothetical protein